MEVWYRFEERTIATGYFGEDGDWHRTGDSSVSITVRELEVLKHTPKGVWLVDWSDGLYSTGKRFVLKEVRKGFARPSIEAARADFVARKTRQAEIYETRARTARRAIKLAQRGEVRKTMYGSQIDETLSFKSSLLRENI